VTDIKSNNVASIWLLRGNAKARLIHDVTAQQQRRFVPAPRDFFSAFLPQTAPTELFVGLATPRLGSGLAEM